MKLQVKYCYNEIELNDFLATLNIDGELPKVHNITYIPQCSGSGENDKVQIGSEIIAVVQYVE